ncbi:hypothetical protein [Oceaniradius stylonematis]|uniref:hypothetical protein n=1 Tax=Oceaniradius stylonematis TaxID=2184161 RepID=UPI003B59670D
MPAADANHARAGFDWRRFARAVDAAHKADGRGLRAIAPEIGVTTKDLSKAMGGANIGIGKVMAICDWAGVSERSFYRCPKKEGEKTDCYPQAHVKHETVSRSQKADRPPAPDCDPGSPCVRRSARGRQADTASEDQTC